MVCIALVAFVVAASPVERQLTDLERIIQLEGRDPELLFRLGDLWMEQSRALLLQGAPKASTEAMKHAVPLFAEIAQEHAGYARADEALFFLGKALLELGDERRAAVAFQRLIGRHPQSRFIAESHFALGEHLFTKSNGRRDWLTRALAEFVAASGEGSAVRSDALYKQGWCLLNLQDFDGAQSRFREVVALGGARATDAERDFVRAFERGGGKPAESRAALRALAGTDARRWALTELLAKLYRDDGFDAEAALTWQQLIQERPRAKETLAWQQEVIRSLMRMGRKPLVVAQVQRLVKMKSELDGDVSEAEPLLAGLATGWHTECRKTREEGCLAFPEAIYAAYLALFPSAPRSYELRFFHAELLYAAGDFVRAAQQYRLVVQHDVEHGPGRFMEAAAWGEIKAREALVQEPRKLG